jgi:chemotaxis response regulator CheB
MDLRMPVMDGYEATRRIKAEEGGQQTIIVALTASAFEEDRQVLEIGCDDFVRKPFHQTVLFETLAHHLDMRYTYAGEPAGKSLALTSADLATLPPEMLTRLREAASIADDGAGERAGADDPRIPLLGSAGAAVILQLQLRNDRLALLTGLLLPGVGCQLHAGSLPAATNE